MTGTWNGLRQYLLISWPDMISYTTVIATVGDRDSLSETVRRILALSIPPQVIVIVLPPDTSLKVDLSGFSRIKVVNSPVGGQVNQRHFGVSSMVFTEWVLYCDDDILIDGLDHLLVTPLSKTWVIGPIFQNISGEKLQRHLPFQNSGVVRLFKSLFPWSDGDVTLFGFGLPFSYESMIRGCPVESFIEREWLPGGCLFFPSKLFPKVSYYPFDGYAYGEDVALSLMMRDQDAILMHSFEFKARMVDANLKMKAKPMLTRFRSLMSNLSRLMYLAKLRGKLN